ncbi:hypothetical protein [Burkholderia cenocepacia]|uniref:hypothetical protein n=1 Tax=Burkholderia cenocepacia TaxID=95486 RepID=UPI000761AFA9|nr:hypothetical protein [Burkholderia cenocepacia]KWU24742.1 hypothetical protein AS149_31860 [Burkholderia cenocepacia]
MDSILAILLPALLFFHVIWAMVRAGRSKRALLTVMPSLSLALATLWLASSILALWNGGLSPERAHANHTLGPVMLGVLLFTSEVPFLVNRLTLWRAGRRAPRIDAQTPPAKAPPARARRGR